ncbi:RNA recognition motif domain-containing protein [Flavihumibacter petaseus]|uniref:Putative RNA-binding region n=1 Tax=Flavihumibacter petaseus NBRC 106054 TaxID=1220578 RepID=A0A0E9N0L2_9BACT|nr:RNA-binding protein [Flavihumibacter petaseus]GAO43181.1 putative RNA-binding region [Flavihumibacter petaseus NBRC 106054]
MNMYVSNLGYQVQENDLLKLFSQYGEVTSARVITDRETGRSRGFGFVEMSSNEDANKAMAELNSRELDGRAIAISVAREKESRAPRNKW